MKLMDLMKRGALTRAVRENSRNSENSSSRGVKVASALKNKIIKNSNNSNNSYSYTKGREERTGEYGDVATAIPAIVAIDENAVPYVAEDYFCPSCGKAMEVFYQVGQPYDGPCWGCIGGKKH